MSKSRATRNHGFHKSVSFLDGNQDHRTYGINHIWEVEYDRFGGAHAWKRNDHANHIEVYGCEELRDRIIYLLNKHGFEPKEFDPRPEREQVETGH